MDLMRWIQISSNLPSPLTVSYEYAIVFFSGIRRLLDETCNGKKVDEWNCKIGLKKWQNM
ncbi:hypothetical protein ACMD2_24780 [Ananas comosus]|uniref:Uncharacterized protein n=1 Tax=Ananas comosus TaxID=4615 RepID=A0A199UY08_ANACO|nr:hypothetical protein ACMD2_24780 [Ananas comosus]